MNRYAELVTRRLGLTRFQQRVRQVFANVGPLRRQLRGFAEVGDRSVVVPIAQCLKRSRQRRIRRVLPRIFVGRLVAGDGGLSERNRRQQAER